MASTLTQKSGEWLQEKSKPTRFTTQGFSLSSPEKEVTPKVQHPAEVPHAQIEISVNILASLGGQAGNVREGMRHVAGGGLLKRSTLLHVLAATAFSVLLICAALARQGTKMAPDAKTMTIEGAVRDLACPIQNPAGTATSFSLQCTLDCVKHGSPIIILTRAGEIYFPISKDMPDSDQRERMMPFVGKYVQATGPAFTRNGTHAIAITEIKELKSVHVDTDAPE